MIGDGMGPEEIKLASLVEYGAENLSIMDQFPVQAFYKTDNVDGELTDSAAGGTAIATGQLTKNSVISMDATKSIRIKTILEYLRDDFGYSTGLITTTEFAHATPAVFGSHTTNRDNKKEIKDQLLSSGIDLILGGGREVSYVGGADAAKSMGEKYGYTTVTNVNELNSLDNSSDKVLGVFGTINMPFELERNPSVDPSLIEMTSFGLKYLQSKNNPFFVMIEGGRIDQAGHLPLYFENKTLYNAMETIMFEKSVRLALDFAKKVGNTIVVVAADHETGGLQIHDYSNLDNDLPEEGLSRDENNRRRIARVNEINASWLSTSHTPTPVKFFGYGSDFGNIVIDTIDDVFWAINAALGSFPTIRNDKWSFTDSSISLSFSIEDRDYSTTGYEVTGEFENGSTYSSGIIPVNLEKNDFFNVTIPITNSSQRFTFQIKVFDGTESTSSLKKVFDGIEETSMNSSISSSVENAVLSPIFAIAFGIPLIIRKRKVLQQTS